MSTISAGTTSGTALVNTGDTTGQLILQTNGTTTAVTIGTNQVVTLAQPLPVGSGGTGSTATATAGGVGYGTGTAQAFTAAGTSGQALVSNGASAPTFGTLGVSGGGTGQTSLTANNVILGNGTSAVQFVDPGTNGNVLTSNGTTWTSAAASTGALVFLSSQTASNSATVDLETTFNSTYETYMVVASNIYVPTNNATLGVRLKISGSYQTASYKWHIIGPTSGATTYVGFNNSSDSAMTILPDIDAGTAFVNEFVFYINEPTNTSKYKMIWGLGISWDQGNSNLHNNHFAGAYFGGTGAMTGIRFLASSGNISSGTFRLYGIKKS